MISDHYKESMMDVQNKDTLVQTEIEAAVFRRLVKHLQEHTEVQNIDLMNLAGFCRNCLAKWYRAEAESRGLDIPDPDARQLIYGMPYEEWKACYRSEERRVGKECRDRCAR